MANSQQAKKRARQNSKRNLHNSSLHSTMRTAIKKVRAAIAEKNKSAASELYAQAKPMIDKMAGKKILSPNAAARYKSRLNAAIQQLS